MVIGLVETINSLGQDSVTANSGLAAESDQALSSFLTA